MKGMVKLGMKVIGEFWKKHICSRTREVCKQVWKMALMTQKGGKSMYK